MDFMTVNTDKCRRDGICVLECPARIIEMTEHGPAPANGAEENCIRCGHCVAVCPEAAMSLSFLSPEQCLDVDENKVPDETGIEQILRHRRSIRSYRKKGVEKLLLEKAIRLATFAPTASNTQSVKWLIVHERKRVQTIAAHVIDWMRHVMQEDPETALQYKMESLVNDWDNGIDRICRDAPHLIIAYGSDEISRSPVNCHTALAYLELALPSFGLGSCWDGYVQYASTLWPGLQKELDLPENHSCYGVAMVGYPSFKYKRMVERNSPELSYL